MLNAKSANTTVNLKWPGIRRMHMEQSVNRKERLDPRAYSRQRVNVIARRSLTL